MDNRTAEAIKNCPLFASLDVHSNVFQALVAQCQTVTLAEDQTLFDQGSASENLYILVAGQLAISLATTDTKSKIVNYILPYDTVGELGALSGEPRSATVKAVENSTLLKLPGHMFKKLCRQYPSVLYAVVGRSQQMIQSLFTKEKKRHIALIAANQYTNTDHFEQQIRRVLKHYKRVALISESALLSEKKSPEYIEKFIAETERKNVIVLYLLHSHETPLAKICWQKISKIYVVAEGNSRPHFDPFVLEKLHNTKHLVEMRRELVLLYQDKDTPHNTSEWLKKADFFLHHQIRVDHLSDYQRLLRFIREKTIGLVLSGGGARGWAHMGALKAILESHIPIDAIGGTSVGAIVGAMYLLTQTYEGLQTNFEDLFPIAEKIVSWKHFCWPAVSLFNCKDYTLESQRIFGSKKIENLWLPYFCITCNLGLYKEEVHRTGLLWEKNRGSMAVPGLIPPMVINGELHIDGGLVNNLPVNSMRELLGAESKVIAVELMTTFVDCAHYQFPPTLTFREAFLAKLGLGYRSYQFPHFMETFVKSLLVGASLKQKENSLNADVLIAPDVTQFNMLHANKKGDNEKLFELGYNTASDRLSQWNFKK
jgi:NTE family protein